MTVNDADERRVDELLAPLADIPPVPYRDRRPARGRRWLRPVLVTAAGLAVVIAVGAAIVTARGGSAAEPAGISPAPAPVTTGAPGPVTTGAATTTGTATPAPIPAWFVKDGSAAAVPPATGTAPGDERGALERLLAGPPTGYTSKVPAGTKLEAFDVADTIATVRLSGPKPKGLALEQIVRTVTLGGDVHWLRLGDDPALLNTPIVVGKGVDGAPPIELVRAQSDGSKVRFAGTADTFEANVQLRLVQGTRELARTFVTATCGSGCRGSFDGTMDVPAGLLELDPATGVITAKDGHPVQLEAYTLSAEDGSERDPVSIPVTAG